MRWTPALAFFQLLQNFFIRLIACCALPSAARCCLRQPGDGTTSPFESVANRTTPISMPTASPWATGCSTSRMVCIESNHFPLRLLTVSAFSLAGHGPEAAVTGRPAALSAALFQGRRAGPGAGLSAEPPGNTPVPEPADDARSSVRAGPRSVLRGRSPRAGRSRPWLRPLCQPE
jgi:hypothetical protein